MSIEDGIRASPSAGASGSKTLHIVGKNNYSAWSDRTEADLLSYELWDRIIGDRAKLVILTAILDAAGTTVTNQARIDTETTELRSYMKDFRTASRIILNSISDEHMAYIKPVITDPVAVWKRLQNKFERKTEVAKEAAHMAFLNFEHSEIETADSLIERFEKAVQLCEQQGLPQSEDIQLRMLLARPSDRYSTLKTIF